MVYYSKLDFSLKKLTDFKGFSSKGGTVNNRASDPPTGNEETGGSMLDQLKNELLKRAQFLSNNFILFL
jgi:hypothetical protein